MEQEQKKRDNEARARLTAPWHVTLDHFRKHVRVEGYIQNQDLPDFLGCDRLLKLDHQYGTIQLGYDPRRERSFLFARIKTSIFDTAASRYQKELKEYQMMRSLKDEGPNTLYSARRRADTAVLLYKAEPKPWTEQSIRPYLMRLNQGALRKTMPFLLRQEEHHRLEESRERRKELELEVAETLAEGTDRQTEEGDESTVQQVSQELAGLRAEQLALTHEQDSVQALLVRKEQQSRLFFRKLNYAFDIQKHEMFRYYRELRQRLRARAAAPAEEPPKKPGKGDEQEGDRSE